MRPTTQSWPPRPRLPGSPARALLIPTVLAGAAALSGCGDEPPALEAAGLAYTRSELLGLSEQRKILLGELAGLGRAVATGGAEALADPLVERAQLEYLARVRRADVALDSAGVEDDVLEARYRTDPDLELTVRHLLVLSERYETDATRAAARTKAERALERIRAGEPFPDVAAEVSEEPGAEGREGLLEPGREGSWVPEFWAAATALDPGEISDVVETQYGFHVLRLEARDTVPFDEVRSRVALDVAELLGANLDPYAEDRGPPIEVEAGLADLLADASTDASRAVARWDDGSMTVGELRRHLATLPDEAWRTTRDDPDALRDEARRAARLRRSARAAGDAGASTPPSVEAGVRRSWDDALARWTYVFGFDEGMSHDALRVAALRALGATGQGPGAARDEVHRRGPLVRLRYPVRMTETDGDGRP
ncbi:MAG: peptidylprolyl isomerase [Gemmatimonadota bacterium]|jgi:hypothetical protein